MLHFWACIIYSVTGYILKVTFPTLDVCIYIYIYIYIYSSCLGVCIFCVVFAVISAAISPGLHLGAEIKGMSYLPTDTEKPRMQETKAFLHRHSELRRYVVPTHCLYTLPSRCFSTTCVEVPSPV